MRKLGRLCELVDELLLPLVSQWERQSVLARIETGDEAAQRNVVHDLLDLLDVVLSHHHHDNRKRCMSASSSSPQHVGSGNTYLDAIEPLPQTIVFEVQQLETGMELLDEARQADGGAKVAERDAVDSEAREVVDCIDQGVQVVLCDELDFGRG